jgi:hypothetical protein
MGANAQTSVPTFVSGQVLTSAQQNLINTGVPVAAGTAERDGLFGGSGEKTLAEGQLVYVESLDVVQYYDGSVWATLGPTTPGGLVLITGASFSAVASVTLDNVFTSTYRNYKLVLQYETSANAAVTAQMRVGGVAATTNYNFQELYGVATTAGAARSTAQSQFVVSPPSIGSFLSCAETLFVGPQLAQATVGLSNTYSSSSTYAAPQAAIYGFNHSTATAYDGFALSVGTGTMTGNYQLYGLAN